MEKKLLLVEDSATMRQLVQFALAGETIDLEFCSDGDGVLNAAESLTPDLLLIDQSLPGQSSEALARDLKKNSL